MVTRSVREDTNEDNLEADGGIAPEKKGLIFEGGISVVGFIFNKGGNRILSSSACAIS